MAEKGDKLIYFFRFEDVIANPRKELCDLMQFVLGLESIEGTVIEHRINEVLNWDPSKNQGYTPRTKGKRSDKTQYFTDEMIEYST